MALSMDNERLYAIGISSPYASVEDLYYTSGAGPANHIDQNNHVLSWSDVFFAILHPQKFQEYVGIGCSGWGMDWYVMDALAPALVWFLGLLLLRYVCREPLARIGLYCGVVTENEKLHSERLARGLRGTRALSRKNAQTLAKFQNQLWLSLFYILSTAYGYMAQRDKSWLELPLTYEGASHLILPHPYNPPREIMLYYNYALGFYAGEVVSLIFFEKNMKRSDFLECVCHHFLTVALLVMSHVGWEHRVGSYIIFIHDASDIMLSVSKTLHYMVSGNTRRQKSYDALHKKLGDGMTFVPSFMHRYIITENVVNLTLGCFVASFFYFRLYCFPMLASTCAFGLIPRVLHGNFNQWLLTYMLNIGLQALHVYWATLIVSLIYKLVRGGERKDIRSDDDAVDEEPLRESDCVSWAGRTSSKSSSMTTKNDEGNARSRSLCHSTGSTDSLRRENTVHRVG